MNDLKNIIEEKLENAEKDRDKLYDLMMSMKYDDVYFKPVRNKFYRILGNIEAYIDILNLKEIRDE